MKIEQKLCIMVALIASVSFLTYPVSAETGSIVLVDDAIYDYSVYNLEPAVLDYSYIRIASESYNYLSSFHVHVTGMNSAHGWESTPFTIVSGYTGTGVGYAWYDLNTSAIYYSFPQGTVTASPIILQFQNNIFLNLSGTRGCGVSNGICGLGIPSSSSPVFVGNGHIATGTYSSVVGTHTVDYYTVIYPGNDLFMISINKTPPIQTKYFVYGDSEEYMHEGTYNSNDIINATFIYGSGIWLNATLSSGIYTIVQINTTGSAGYVPPGNELVPDTVTGVGIVFGAATYSINAIANISWIRTINTPLLCTDYVRLQSPNEKYDIVVSPSNSGYTKELLSLLGTYTVSFERDCLFSSSETLASDTVFVGTTEQTSYINTPAQVGVGQLFNVSYLIGWTKTTGSTVWLRDYSWDNTTNSYSSTYQSWALSGSKNVETNQSILVTKTGKHLLKLCDVLLGCKASTILTAYFNGSEVTTNITYSNITLDKTSYSYGETMLVKVAIDNYNWTGKQIVVDYFDADEGLIQNQYYVQEQIQSIPLYISDLTFSGSGSALLRLVGRNASGEYVLATAAFTLSNVDAEGYGLSVTGEECKGDIVQIKVIVPAGETGNLSISADNVKYNKNYVINGTKIISYKYPISGSYYITLRVNDEAKRVIIKTITDCGVPSTTVTYPGTNGTWTSTQDNIQSTCSFWDTCVRGVFGSQGVNDVSRLLFALGCIMAAMFVGMVASKGNFGVSVVLGFLPYAFFAYLSMSTPCGQYMPLWITIMIALVIGIKLKWFS